MQVPSYSDLITTLDDHSLAIRQDFLDIRFCVFSPLVDFFVMVSPCSIGSTGSAELALISCPLFRTSRTPSKVSVAFRVHLRSRYSFLRVAFVLNSSSGSTSFALRRCPFTSYLMCVVMFHFISDPDIRFCVLSSLDDWFDAHLAKAENLAALFVALNDEVFPSPPLPPLPYSLPPFHSSPSLYDRPLAERLPKASRAVLHCNIAFEAILWRIRLNKLVWRCWPNPGLAS